MKKILSVIMAALMLFAVASFAFAADAQTALKVQIEGIKKTLYNDTVTVSKTATVLDAVKATGVDVVTSNSQYGAYIVSIGGDASATFGGWDGWLFELDGVEGTASADQVTIGDAAELLLYYGDPYGKGMQRPVGKQNIAEGYITFTSKDTVTNWETGQSVTTENPVAGAKVTFDNGTVLTTDEAGKIVLTDDLKKAGDHSYTIEKYAENGLPLVLRATENYTVEDNSVGAKILAFFSNIWNWIVNLFQKIASVFSR